jgi:DNA-binding winged helix-turn-helix (wHTH) protein/TolB-like protein/Flp pilus assembly protein TadD
MPLQEFRVGDWLVQPSLNRLARGDQVAPLQPRFMDLLVCLANTPGKVVSKEEILDEVWGKEFVSEGTLTHAVAVIRQTLGDDVRRPTYIETIPTRGYRLIAPVTAVEEDAPPAKVSQGIDGRRHGFRRVLLPLAGLALAVAAITWLIFRGLPSSGHGSANAEVKRIVVLPFENLGPSAQEYVASGITDDITTRLAAARGLGVISRTSAEFVAKSDEPTKKMGADLAVDYVLEGSVHWEGARKEDARVRINAQLIRVRDDTHLWVGSYEPSFAQIFDASTAIAAQVIHQLGVRVGAPEQSRLTARPSANPDAYQAYLCGLRYQDLESREQLGMAVAMFERAVKLDPTFALAYAELSIAHSRMNQLGFDPTSERLVEAEKAARRALSLRPDLPEAHLAMGVLYYLGRHDYARALEEFNVAASGLPNNPALLGFIADVHRRQGKWADAWAEIDRANSLDPRNYGVALQLGDTLMFLREYQRADAAFQRATDLMPDSIHPYLRRFWNYLAWDGSTTRAAQVLGEMPVPDYAETAFFRFYSSFCNHDYRGALEALSSAPREVSIEPFGTIHEGLLEYMGHEALRDSAQARQSCAATLAMLKSQESRRLNDPRLQAELALASAGLGLRSEALAAAARAVALCPVDQDAVEGPVYLLEQAFVQAHLGESEAAVRNLERLLALPGFVSLRWLRLDPSWAPLRNAPAFQALGEPTPAAISG